MYKAATSVLSLIVLVLSSVFGVHAQMDGHTEQLSSSYESESVFFNNNISFGQDFLLGKLNDPFDEPQSSEKKSEENRGNEDKDDELQEQHKNKFYDVFVHTNRDFDFSSKGFCVCLHFLNALSRKPKRALFLLNHQWKNEIL